MKKIQRNLIFGLGIFLMIGMYMPGMAISEPEKLYAKGTVDAVKFYEQYNDGLTFVEETEGTGVIYCVLKNDRKNMTYRNIGWQFHIYSGEEYLETVIYKLGGDYFRLADIQYTEDGRYQYELFGLRVGNLKSRISMEVRDRMEQGTCSIRVDSCIAPAKDGLIDGFMDDYKMRGNVLCTYEQVMACTQLTADEKAGLKDAFGKSVQQLFYMVSAEGDEGIEQIQGTGSYCYGDRARLKAVVRDGYLFCDWNNGRKYYTKAINFRVYRDTAFVVSTVSNQPPEIYAQDMYFSLEQAKKGLITEEVLGEHVYAQDMEDGRISYGNHLHNSLVLIDYAPEDMTSFQKAGSVTETFCATDSGGNTVKKTVWIHLVDTAPATGRIAYGEPRWISRRYFEKEDRSLLSEEAGGLPGDSCWVVDEEYRMLLQEVLWREEEK